MIPSVTSRDFKKRVLEAPRPVLVEFYTTVCPTCRSMTPILEKLAEEFDGRADILRVNAMEEPSLANTFKIQAVPTFVVFDIGQVKTAWIGGKPEEVIRETLLSQIV